MLRLISLISLTASVAGCATLMAPREAATELRLGGGYRGLDDPCVRVGQTDFTAPLLREDADLVGCPIDFEGRPAFQTGTGGREVGRTDAWVLYSVPLLSGEG